MSQSIKFFTDYVLDHSWRLNEQVEQGEFRPHPRRSIGLSVRFFPFREVTPNRLRGSGFSVRSPLDALSRKRRGGVTRRAVAQRRRRVAP